MSGLASPSATPNPAAFPGLTPQASPFRACPPSPITTPDPCNFPRTCYTTHGHPKPPPPSQVSSLPPHGASIGLLSLPQPLQTLSPPRIPSTYVSRKDLPSSSGYSNPTASPGPTPNTSPLMVLLLPSLGHLRLLPPSRTPSIHAANKDHLSPSPRPPDWTCA